MVRRNFPKLHSFTHIIHIPPSRSTYNKYMDTDIYVFGTNDVSSCADTICNGHLVTNKESRSSKTITMVPFVSNHFNNFIEAPQNRMYPRVHLANRSHGM
jgi:hypothetical protein